MGKQTYTGLTDREQRRAREDKENRTQRRKVVLLYITLFLICQIPLCTILYRAFFLSTVQATDENTVEKNIVITDAEVRGGSRHESVLLITEETNYYLRLNGSEEHRLLARKIVSLKEATVVVTQYRPFVLFVFFPWEIAEIRSGNEVLYEKEWYNHRTSALRKAAYVGAPFLWICSTLVIAVLVSLPVLKYNDYLERKRTKQRKAERKRRRRQGDG